MINKLLITSGFKNGRSYLKDRYYTRPFRLANVGEQKTDPSLYLMVMSSSPGILDGDQYEIRILVEKSSRLQLQSQSYQRLFKMEKGARQDQLITMEEGSTFSYVPHPVVPHNQSAFKAVNIVRMQDHCNLTLGEIITCGRKHSGEVFQFTCFQNVTTVYHHDKLLIKDNILIRPGLMEMHAIGHMEGYTHQATLIHVNTDISDQEELNTFVQELLDSEKDIAGAITHPNNLVTVVRVLGNGGEQLFNLLRKIQRHIWEGHRTVEAVLTKTMEETFSEHQVTEKEIA